MLHHCRRITWCSFKKGILQGEASVLHSLPLPSLASLVLSFFCSVLCIYWWLHLLLTSASVIFYCMNVIVRWPECHQAMILHTLDKTELLAMLTCYNWSTWSLFLMLCKESIARPWLTKIIYLMNVICVHTLFCGFRIISAGCGPSPGINQVPRLFRHWAYATPWLRRDTRSYATVVWCTYFSIDITSEVHQTDWFYVHFVRDTCNVLYWAVQVL